MNIDNFLLSLAVMGKGMAGIFAVTIVIVIAMILLNKLGSGSKKDSNEQ